MTFLNNQEWQEVRVVELEGNFYAIETRTRILQISKPQDVTEREDWPARGDDPDHIFTDEEGNDR